MSLRVSYLGHASFLVQTAGLNILVDPVWSERASPVSFAGPRRVNDPGIAFDDLPPIDVVLVCHNHAYRHSAPVQVVWWMESELPLSLASTYTELATVLGLVPAEITDQVTRVRAVRDWLEHHGGWLLVFDNATDSQPLRAYLPRSQTGQLLITSRNPEWSTAARPLPMRVLPCDESIALLVRSTGFAADGAMDALAHELADLPLAVAPAAGCIRAASISVVEYLQLFRSRRSELWAQKPLPEDYGATIATT